MHHSFQSLISYSNYFLSPANSASPGIGSAVVNTGNDTLIDHTFLPSRGWVGRLLHFNLEFQRPAFSNTIPAPSAHGGSASESVPTMSPHKANLFSGTELMSLRYFLINSKGTLTGTGSIIQSVSS